MKTCKKCNIEKDYAEFYKEKKSKDGHENTCILCRKYQKAIYWKNNKDKLTDKRKLFNENNKEHIKERQKKYYHENKEKISENIKKYKNNNKEKFIIPISHAITEDDVYKLNRFDNFQPLCSMKNLEKSNKFYDTYSMGNNSSSTI